MCCVRRYLQGVDDLTAVFRVFVGSSPPHNYSSKQTVFLHWSVFLEISLGFRGDSGAPFIFFFSLSDQCSVGCSVVSTVLLCHISRIKISELETRIIRP